MKKYIIPASFILITISIAIFASGIDWTSNGIVLLLNPTNNTQYINLGTQTENFTSNISSSGELINNISLYHDFDGSWLLRASNFFSNSNSNESHGMTGKNLVVSDSPRHFFINKTSSESNVGIISMRVQRNAASSAESADTIQVNQSSEGSLMIGNVSIIWVNTTTGFADFGFLPITNGENYSVTALNVSDSSISNIFWQQAVIPDSGNITWYPNSGDRIWSIDQIELGVQGKNIILNETITFTDITIPFGNYNWSVEGCASDHTCGFATNGNFSLSNVITQTSETFQSNVFETDSQSFELNFTSLTAPISGFLNWNNTITTATLTSSGQNYTLTSLFDIPILNGSVPISWNITLPGTILETTNTTQDVASINLSQMKGGAPQDIAFFNITFKNETTAEESVTATIPRSSFTYFLGTGAVNKTLSFTSATEFNNYTLAFSPRQRAVNVSVDLDYDNSVSQQRTFNPENLFSLSNTTTEQVLFLLPTNDGIFVTFQVINSAEQPIDDANVRIEKGGTLISETQTGASGTTNIFLNPNTLYFLNVTKTGFNEFSTTQTFPTSEFTINLGGETGTTNIISFLDGITFQVQPKSGILQNNTNYNFNFTINTTKFVFEEFGFDLVNKSGFSLGRVTSTNSIGGIVALTNNTGNQTLIQMNYFWKINGSYVNGTVPYGIDEFTDGSIQSFVNRLRTYLTSGIFGLDDFGFAIIIFLSIFLTVGILSFKFGLRAPEAILTIAVLVIGLFDVGLGLIPSPFENAIPGVPTILSFMILMAVWLRRNR